LLDPELLQFLIIVLFQGVSMTCKKNEKIMFVTHSAQLEELKQQQENDSDIGLYYVPDRGDPTAGS
jgi:hypothetical protein